LYILYFSYSRICFNIKRKIYKKYYKFKNEKIAQLSIRFRYWASLFTHQYEMWCTSLVEIRER